MKTIQQVMKEMNLDHIENAYFYKYPVNLHSIKESDDMTVSAVKDKISKRFQDYLNRLLTMEIERDDKNTWILFAYKSYSIDQCNEVGLIKAVDLVKAKDLSSVNTYEYVLTEQKEALGFLVADNKLTQDSIMDVVVEFLYEMSWFGYEQEGLEEEKRSLDDSIKECEEHPERMKAFDLDDLRDEFGLPIKEEYPREEELIHEIFNAEHAYTMYCRNIELERIKKDIIEQGIA